MSAVRHHPLVAFFVLTYALTWGFLPLGIFGATGPLIAALIVLAITEGWAGLRDLGSRMIRWRVGWYWYALAIGLPLAVFLLIVALNVALGAPAPSLARFSPWYAVIVVFAVRLSASPRQVAPVSPGTRRSGLRGRPRSLRGLVRLESSRLTSWSPKECTRVVTAYR